MSVVITERIFTDEFTGAGGGGVTYPNSGVLSKLTAQIDFYSYLARIQMNLEFNAATKTITNNNPNDNSSFLGDSSGLNGFKEGMTLTVEDTVSNNGSYTIADVTERVITVVEALVNEVDTECSLFDDTPITALDFYYNLIENSLPESYLSLADKGAVQRFTVDGIDATVTGSTANMLVSSASFGWVTNKITNLTTGETNEVTIIGMGISAHKQKFRITQIFHIAPFTLREQLVNFQNRFAPDYFADGKALKYICKIDAKFSFTDPDIPHTGSLIDINGLTNWFDQNNIRSRPEYFTESVTYTDLATGDPLDRLDINKSIEVLVTLKSRNGKFTADATEIALDFLYLPLDEADYVHTPDTILRQNLMNDRKFMLVATGADGEYFGTDYQVLSNITVTYIDTETLEIEFDFAPSTFLKNIIKAKSSDNRNYAIVITTQDQSILTTIQTDRVPVLCDVQNMDWNQDDTTLLEAVDTFRNYMYPNIDSEPKNNVAGYEGDPIYSEFPFRVETAPVSGVTPTLQMAGIQIVAIKSGKDDFILEEKRFDVALVRKLDNAQTIDIAEDRNFTYNNEEHLEYNQIKLNKSTTYDSGTKKGFILSYPFVLRYEFWKQAILLAEGAQYDVFEDVEKVTEEWSNYAEAGWSLKLRFIADVLGYDGHTTQLFAETNIIARKLGDPADLPPTFEQETFYYSEDGVLVGHTDITNVDGGAMVIGERTRVVAKFTGNLSLAPTGTSMYGYLFADLENEGGINNRRFASSEILSEDDSPWSPTDPDGGATSTRVFGNARLNIYGTTHVTIEAWYDDTIQQWGTRVIRGMIYFRIGFFAGDTSLRQFEDGELHLWEDDEQASFEN